jgi:phenylacetate-CoA ligase
MILELFKNWTWLQRAQWFDEQKLKGIHDRRLREIVERAYLRVPFYHRRFEAAHVSPMDIVDVGKIRKIPKVTRDDFRSTSLELRTATNTNLDMFFKSSPNYAWLQ